MEKYSKEKYGPKGTNESFCMAGFGSFLIYLVQLQSIAKGWKTDVYLQANQAQEAVAFYKRVGFGKLDSNSVEELPEAWRDKVNSKDVPDFYIKFVDDATNSREAEE